MARLTPFRVAHLFGGLGGAHLGFRRAGFVGAGAVDVDAPACRDFQTLTGDEQVQGDLLEMTPSDVRAACGKEAPDVLFTSPPCKGFSGCLPEGRASQPRYLALNSLAFRGIWLALEAWPKPPAMIVLENVPRILSRGRQWLDQIVSLLHAYGYAVSQTTHDCGELGGLAQHRRRFLLVARHMEQLPAFLRVPPSRRVRGIGEVLGELPVPWPGTDEGGGMHRLPKLATINWVRLALIPAGGDWRDIPAEVQLPPRDARQNGPYGVETWDSPSHAVLGSTTARDTWGSVADPRVGCQRREGGHGVKSWDQPSAPVIGHPSIDNFPCQVADPRIRHEEHRGCRGVQAWEGPSKTIRAAHNMNNAPAAVSDPRMGCSPRPGTMGVEDWTSPSHAVIGGHVIGKARAAVADPRVPQLVGPPIDLSSKRPLYLVIRAEDGTWHRPMTTLELAVLQGFPARLKDAWLQLDGNSHAGWRERIGNAVPPPAAEAIARSCAVSLAAARSGLWELSNDPVWVRQRALELMGFEEVCSPDLGQTSTRSNV